MKISAQYIAKEDSWYSAMLFVSSILSVRKFVDEIIVVDNGCSDFVKEMYFDALINTGKEYRVLNTDAVRFDDKRNVALKNSDANVILWVDSDEVHFPDELAKVKQFLENPDITEITTSFYHLVRDPKHYREIQPRRNIFRRNEKTRWDLPVHETLRDIPDGLKVHTPYTYLHLGYTKPRTEVLSHWVKYSELEGKPDHYDKNNLDPTNDLHGQYNGLAEYTGTYPEELSWLFEEKLLEEHGIQFGK